MFKATGVTSIRASDQPSDQPSVSYSTASDGTIIKGYQGYFHPQRRGLSVSVDLHEMIHLHQDEPVQREKILQGVTKLPNFSAVQSYVLKDPSVVSAARQTQDHNIALSVFLLPQTQQAAARQAIDLGPFVDYAQKNIPSCNALYSSSEGDAMLRTVDLIGMHSKATSNNVLPVIYRLMVLAQNFASVFTKHQNLGVHYFVGYGLAEYKRNNPKDLPLLSSSAFKQALTKAYFSE